MRLETVIGTTIWLIRKEKKIQAKDLAARIPMSRSYLSEIEHGHQVPSIAMLQDIADGLDLHITDLLDAFTRQLEQQNV